MKYLLLLCLFLTTVWVDAQNLYPEKFDACHLRSFCLDCGDPKAAYPADLTHYFQQEISATALRKASGTALVQVLVDSAGRPCVLSQTSNMGQHTMEKLDLRGIINAMSNWNPAQEKGKPVHSSMSLRFAFNETQVIVSYQHFDFAKMNNMRSVGEVEIINKHQHYSSPPKDIVIETFTTQNSKIPWDMMRAVSIDQQHVAWVGTDNGLVRVQDGAMTLLNATNSGLLNKLDKKVSIMYSAIDTHNNKWFTDGYRTYRFDGTTWTRFDSTSSPLRWVVNIAADATGNVWFGGGKNLVKYDGHQWTEFTAQNSKLPSGLVAGVFVDQKNRVWASTYRGTVRFDGSQVEEFNKSDNPLAHAAFNCAQQDSDGTIWFGLYDSDRKGTYNGLAKYTPEGKWESFTTENSGYPGNSVQSLIVDTQHHVVWAGINRVGLCRFDGRSWTLFTPDNSAVPSTIVEDLALDTDGNLWGATFAGLFKLHTR
jgi:sugar lactone lactonase YvrE